MSDPYRQIVAHGGMFEEEFMLTWLLLTDLLSVLPPAVAEVSGPDERVEAAGIWIEHLLNIPVSIGWIMDPEHILYGDFYRHKAAMLYWPAKPAQGFHYESGLPIPEGGMTIPEGLPAFMVGGWFDLFTAGTLECYQYGLARQAPGDKALIMGPWCHVTAGMGCGLEALAGQELVARWFDWKIKGQKDSFMREFPVLLYVMGAERWRREKAWPLDDTRLETRRLYLSERRAFPNEYDWFSKLNALDNFQLAWDTPQVFLYDELDDPVVLRHDPPILHGLASRSADRWLAGALSLESQISKYEEGLVIDEDEPWEDERLDELGVLTFTTAPLEEDVEIIGGATLTFWARTRFGRPLTRAALDQARSVIEEVYRFADGNLILEQLTKEDVQWVVELNDVFPDGRARNITSGWLSAWHRPYDPVDPTQVDPAYTPFDPFYAVENYDAEDHPDFNPIEEGLVYPYTVELWPTANVFRAGHAIRISLSASDFPHLLPLLSPSENTLVLDREHPAHLEFTTTTPQGEGETWSWVRETPGTILEEFSSASEYLLTHQDPEGEAYPEEQALGRAQSAAAGALADSSGNGGLCFIAQARP